jgi:endonuclease-8
MRMNGSWHIYRPGERWQRSRDDMRILIVTEAFVAVGFNA